MMKYLKNQVILNFRQAAKNIDLCQQGQKIKKLSDDYLIIIQIFLYNAIIAIFKRIPIFQQIIAENFKHVSQIQNQLFMRHNATINNQKQSKNLQSNNYYLLLSAQSNIIFIVKLLRKRLTSNMHNNSIQTQFYDDNDYNGLSILPSRSIASSKKNKQQIQISRLEDMITQFTSKIKTNKPLVQQLECQRKFFKKLCEKQKNKIQSINIQIIRNQYQVKMNHLKQERERLHQTIGRLHEESQKNSLNFQNTLRNVLENRQYLLKKLNQIESQNQIYQQIYSQKCQKVQKLCYKVNEKEKILVQKQIIHSKYQDLVKEIQITEKKKGINIQTSNFV